MARPISGKVIVSGELLCTSPIAVGGAGNGQSIDLELAVDGQGRWYVPGTSLAGALRHWIVKHNEVDDKNADFKIADLMMGFQVGDKGHASYLIIKDAPITLPGQPKAEVRTSLQIHRETGTARSGKLFTRQMLPAGSILPLMLELDLPPDKADDSDNQDLSNKFKAILAALINELAEHGISLGGAKRSGLGKVKLESEYVARVFAFPRDFKDWLRLADPFEKSQLKGVGQVLNTDATEEKAATRKKPDRLFMEIAWHPVSPIMVKAAQEGMLSNMLPLVTGNSDGRLSPVIPGSSMKGALRSHASKIIRTVMTNPPGINPNDPNPDPDTGLALELFGTTEKAGRLTVFDTCLKPSKTSSVTVEEWLKEDSDALNQITSHGDHVAIDRFTGGACDSALFSIRAAKPGSDWEPIKMELDFGLPFAEKEKDRNTQKKETGKHICTDNDSLKQATLALLLFVLRDLQAGMIPIGFGANRGLGDIHVDSMTITGKVGTTKFGGNDSKFPYGLDLDSIQKLNDAWKKLREYQQLFVKAQNDDSEGSGARRAGEQNG